MANIFLAKQMEGEASCDDEEEQRSSAVINSSGGNCEKIGGKNCMCGRGGSVSSESSDDSEVCSSDSRAASASVSTQSSVSRGSGGRKKPALPDDGALSSSSSASSISSSGCKKKRPAPYHYKERSKPATIVNSTPATTMDSPPITKLSPPPWFSATNSELSSSSPDYSLKNFDFIRTIGTGTFGRVFLCRDKRSDEYMAMKVLTLSEVLRLKQVDHVRNEKSILKLINHPFLVKLRRCAKDNARLYMLLDYVSGGELFTYLRNSGHFSAKISVFYTAEIITALDYLHNKNIVYRDLKPENLLLDHEGHLKMTDFGFAKVLTDRTWTLCGTPEYLAPEIIQSKGHNKAVDWWALGILIYEMLNGHPPFIDSNAFGIYEKILHGKINWCRPISPVAKDLIKKLLAHDRTKRLGNMKNGAEDVKNHRWFERINWTDVILKRIRPPIVPRVSSPGDSQNFDKYEEVDLWAAKPVKPEYMELFEDF